MRKNVEFAERISKWTQRPMWSQLSFDEALFKAVMMLSPHLIWSPITILVFLVVRRFSKFTCVFCQDSPAELQIDE
jgi:hypothetical protein